MLFWQWCYFTVTSTRPSADVTNYEVDNLMMIGTTTAPAYKDISLATETDALLASIGG